MNGMIGWSGTFNLLFEMVILAPPLGGVSVGSVIEISEEIRVAAKRSEERVFWSIPSAQPSAMSPNGNTSAAQHRLLVCW
jgi:hypothetical protein